MVNTVPNDSNDGRLARLNEKIERYNSLSEIKRPNKANKLEMYCLLQEMYFMGELLKKKWVDAYQSGELFSPDLTLEPIKRWNGVIGEFSKHGASPSAGLSAEMNLAKLSKSIDSASLPQSDEWKSWNSQRKSFLGKKKESVHAEDMIPALNALHDNRPKPEALEETKIQYCSQLKEFKNELIKKINFELDDHKDIKQFRKLLSIVNKEICHLYDSTPRLKAQYDDHIKYSTHEFAKVLAKSTAEEIEILAQPLGTLGNRDATRAEILDSFPALSDFSIKRLGGGNNINWLATNEDTGEQLIIQIGQTTDNQVLLGELSRSSVDEFFTKKYLSTYIAELAPVSLVVSEFLPDGDLYNERKNKYSQLDENNLTILAENRIGQMARFCQELTEHQCMHTDIKLSNFLVNADGELKISDTKGILSTQEGQARARNFTYGTRSYNPPDFEKAKASAQIKAEPYMTYQIGLALYDFCILPKENGDDKWSLKNPLDFDKPYFKTMTGGKMMELIKNMTDADPGKRPSLSEVQDCLKRTALDASNLVSLQKTVGSKAAITSSEKTSQFKTALQGLVDSSAMSDFKKSVQDAPPGDERKEKIAEIKSSNKYNSLNTAAKSELDQFMAEAETEPKLSRRTTYV